MKIKEIISALEQFAPSQLQEDYDNSGLNIGNSENTITGILITIDVTPEIIEEAKLNNCNLIISHHPLIFNRIKKITGSNYVEKSIILAIKNDIAVYCGHTNFDSVAEGVSFKICQKLGLKHARILSPKRNFLKKVIVFVPEKHADQLRQAMFDAGAGSIGNYDLCSFNSIGTGSFKGNEDTNPFVGQKGSLHHEKEMKIEMVFPQHLESKIIYSIIKTHPYEEPAYDIFQMENSWKIAGLGMVGELEKEISESDFFDLVKKEFGISTIKHSNFLNKKHKKIAVCGGSGASLIMEAINSGAGIYLTGDIKYHDYFLAENKIILADIGHFESEQFTKEIFYDIIMKKNPNFVVRFSKTNTNPIKNY
jgi:dinuclear metal center YbgI/SA1388 family protein